MKHIICETCGTFMDIRAAQACIVCGEELPCAGQIRNKRKTRKKQSRSPVYVCWLGMKRRCFDKNDAAYVYYGGRGITVCERWINSFEAFKQDMGPRPDGYTIERENNDGDYEPGNCVWATMHTQNRNTRANLLITLSGKTQVLVDWCAEFGIPYVTARARLKRGWPIKKALRTPVKSPSRRESSPAREAA